MVERKRAERTAIKQTIHNNTQELPGLILRRVKGYGDFKTEEIHFEAKGWTIQEAQKGLNVLIKKFKELR